MPLCLPVRAIAICTRAWLAGVVAILLSPSYYGTSYLLQRRASLAITNRAINIRLLLSLKPTREHAQPLTRATFNLPKQYMRDESLLEADY
jgi:hypothetical protein